MEGETNQETSSGGFVDLDVREVGSEFIPGGVEEWEGKKRIDVFMGKKSSRKIICCFSNPA